jgi:hypothetical protein
MRTKKIAALRKMIKRIENLSAEECVPLATKEQSA